jgi:hypothetical protein
MLSFRCSTLGFDMICPTPGSVPPLLSLSIRINYFSHKKMLQCARLQRKCGIRVAGGEKAKVVRAFRLTLLNSLLEFISPLADEIFHKQSFSGEFFDYLVSTYRLLGDGYAVPFLCRRTLPYFVIFPNSPLRNQDNSLTCMKLKGFHCIWKVIHLQSGHPPATLPIIISFIRSPISDDNEKSATDSLPDHRLPNTAHVVRSFQNTSQC